MTSFDPVSCEFHHPGSHILYHGNHRAICDVCVCVCVCMCVCVCVIAVCVCVMCARGRVRDTQRETDRQVFASS